MYMENKKYYTKIYKDGTKHIFQYKGEANEKGYADTYMSCSNDQPDYFDNSNGSRNIIYIGTEGTSAGSKILKATEEDIQFLHFIRDHWKYDEGKGYLDLPYSVSRQLWNDKKVHQLNDKGYLDVVFPLEATNTIPKIVSYLEERIAYYQELVDNPEAHNSSDRYEHEGRLAAYEDVYYKIKNAKVK